MRDFGNETAGTPASAEHQAVVDFLAAVILEGWRKADAVAALLDAVRGQAFQPAEEPPSLLSAGEVPTGPMAESLSDVGAVLRIAQWERAGLRPYLPPELPTAADAFRCIQRERRSPGTHRAVNLADVQFSVWLMHFVWSACETLGSEVVHFGCPVESEALVDRLAEFLWTYRHGIPAVPENKRETT